MFAVDTRRLLPLGQREPAAFAPVYPSLPLDDSGGGESDETDVDYIRATPGSSLSVMMSSTNFKIQLSGTIVLDEVVGVPNSKDRGHIEVGLEKYRTQ
jgi:hypothetical protein